MNKNSYKKAIDKINFSEDLNEKTLNHISEELNKKSKNKSNKFKIYTSFATAVCAIIIIFTFFYFNNKSDFELLNSDDNVSVKYIKNPPSIHQSADLVWLTEDELINDKWNTDIFMGTVLDIKNIVIDYNGDKDYRAIATIKIDRVYKGNENIGEDVEILIPCPINTNVWVEDTGVVSNIRVGTKGIFMPIKYDETNYCEMNNARVYYTDFVEYGFADGERFAFLETEDGLIFERHAYESIKDANTLDEIEDYIERMMK